MVVERWLGSMELFLFLMRIILEINRINWIMRVILEIKIINWIMRASKKIKRSNITTQKENRDIYKMKE